MPRPGAIEAGPGEVVSHELGAAHCFVGRKRRAKWSVTVPHEKHEGVFPRSALSPPYGPGAAQRPRT